MDNVDSIVKNVLKLLSVYLLRSVYDENQQIMILRYYKDILTNRFKNLDSSIINEANIDNIKSTCLSMDKEFIDSSLKRKLEIINNEKFLNNYHKCVSIVFHLAKERYKTNKMPLNFKKHKDEVLLLMDKLNDNYHNKDLDKNASYSLTDALADLSYASGNSLCTSLAFKHYILSAEK